LKSAIFSFCSVHDCPSSLKPVGHSSRHHVTLVYLYQLTLQAVQLY
jgi:hypothetical protein